MLTQITLCTFTHSKYDIVRHVPRPPMFFFAVWFGFSIVNGSRRVAKNGEGLGTHVRWTRGGCREGRVGGEGEGGSAQLQMCVSWL